MKTTKTLLQYGKISKVALFALTIICMTFYSSILKAGNNDPKINEMVKPNPTTELTLHLEPYVYPNGYNVSCYDRMDGSITLTVSGGVGPYYYDWSNRKHTKDIDSLSASYYQVRVTDAEGKIASAGITLIPPPKEVSDPIINFDIHEYSPNMNVTCYSCCNGMIEISVTGGSGMYTYQWGDGPTTQDRYGLCQGNYQVVIKDVSGCGEFKEHVRNFTINGPDRDDWSMNGNSGIDPNSQFLGTTDNKDFVFRTRDTLRMKIKANGNVGIGTIDPTEKLTVGGNMKVDGKFITNRITYSDSVLIIGDSCIAIDANNNRIYGFHIPIAQGGGQQHHFSEILFLYKGIGIGRYTNANGPHSLAVGVNATVNGGSSIAFGHGILNNIDNSFMVGFNNTNQEVPTLFVGPNTASGTGNVGIGTAITNVGGTDYKLAVKGKIVTQEVVVTLSGWGDYVFDKKYSLLPLSEVEKYINKNKHLPDVPSASEIEKNGAPLGDTQVILLKKIEELTLYVIELSKKNEELQKEIAEMKNSK